MIYNSSLYFDVYWLDVDVKVSILHRLDHILLETTGLANPAPLASVLWLDDQLESDVRLDSIITVSFFLIVGEY